MLIMSDIFRFRKICLDSLSVHEKMQFHLNGEVHSCSGRWGVGCCQMDAVQCMDVAKFLPATKHGVYCQYAALANHMCASIYSRLIK